MKGLSIKTVGLSLGIFFAVSYVLCILFDLVFPGWAMYQVWQGLLPGFSWSAVGFFFGLFGAVIYGFYIAVIFVPIFNYLHRQEQKTQTA